MAGAHAARFSRKAPQAASAKRSFYITHIKSHQTLRDLAVKLPLVRSVGDFARERSEAIENFAALRRDGDCSKSIRGERHRPDFDRGNSAVAIESRDDNETFALKWSIRVSGNESPQLGKLNKKGGEKHEIREAGNRLRG